MTEKASSFLTLWDNLTIAKTFPELRATWKHVLEHSESIGHQRLNELWEFYCERLGEFETGGGGVQDIDETDSFWKNREMLMKGTLFSFRILP